LFNFSQVNSKQFLPTTLIVGVRGGGSAVGQHLQLLNDHRPAGMKRQRGEAAPTGAAAPRGAGCSVAAAGGPPPVALLPAPPAAAAFERDFVRPSLPVLVRGALAGWPALARWQDPGRYFVASAPQSLRESQV
jgi:hypothetical protein